MGTVALIGSSMGLGLASGLFLADSRVLVLAGVAYVIEFFADKIPWVDSLWDGFHTFVRPIGAVVVAGAAISGVDPAAKVVLLLLCGGVALSGHSTKAATRLVVNHSPEPFSNLAVSIAEDLIAPVGAWLAITHPYVMLSVALLFLAIFAWICQKVFRLCRLELNAVVAVMKRYISQPQDVLPLPPGTAAESIAAGIPALRFRMQHLPPAHAEHVRRRAGIDTPLVCIRCAATKSVKGLRNSIGYLCFDAGALHFVTKCWLRFRIHSIPLAAIVEAKTTEGLLLDRLDLVIEDRKVTFYLFKTPEPRAARTITASCGK